jgi:hypothetical protein
MALRLNTSRAQKRHREHAENHPRIQGSRSPKGIVARLSSRNRKDNYVVGSSHEERLLAPLKQEDRIKSLEKVDSLPKCAGAVRFHGPLARA